LTIFREEAAMKKIAISKFKANALEIVDQVAKTKQGLVITRRGKPLAEVVPFRGEDDRPVPGKLSEALVFEKDIVSPLGEDIWEACR
jgi:prevent-host-death family protein